MHMLKNVTLKWEYQDTNNKHKIIMYKNVKNKYYNLYKRKIQNLNI